MRILNYFTLFASLIILSCTNDDNNPASKSNPKIEKNYTVDIIEDNAAESIIPQGKMTIEEIELKNNIESVNYKIFDRVQEDNESNLLLSPYGLQQVIMMAANGADDEAQAELLKLYEIKEESLGLLNSMAYKLSTAIQSEDSSLIINSFNALWIDHNFPIYRSYVNTIRNFYNAETFAIDCKSEESAKVINKWINTNTKGLIQEIIPEQPIIWNASLMNIIYFNASWTDAFNLQNTTIEPFKNSNGNICNVDMMHKEMELLYTNTDEYEMVCVPLEGNFDVTFVMPARCEFNVSTLPSDIINSCEYRLVDFKLPKLKINYDGSLSDALNTCGFSKLVNSAFPKIGPSINKMCDIVQHISLEFNENGTQAAALTMSAVTDNKNETKLEKTKFYLNRPFYFMIRENSMNILLFVGRINNM